MLQAPHTEPQSPRIARGEALPTRRATTKAQPTLSELLARMTTARDAANAPGLSDAAAERHCKRMRDSYSAILAARPVAIPDLLLQLRAIHEDNTDENALHIPPRRFVGIVNALERTIERKSRAKPDPMPALLKRYEAARLAFVAADKAHDAVTAKVDMDRIEVSVGMPTEYIGLFPAGRAFRSETQIQWFERDTRKWLRGQNETVKKQQGQPWKDYRKRLAQLRELVPLLRKGYAKAYREATRYRRDTGYTAATNAFEKASEALSKLEWKIAETVPTTAVGLMLFLAYVERRGDCWDGNWEKYGSPEEQAESFSISGCQMAELARNIMRALELQCGHVALKGNGPFGGVL